MKITRAGTQPSMKGPEGWFSGSVRIDPLFTASACDKRALIMWRRIHEETAGAHRARWQS